MKQQLLIIIATVAAMSVNAQNAVPSTGGDATGTGGSSSFSYGQASYHYISGGGTNSEGVQQTFTIVPVASPVMAKPTNAPIISAIITATPITASVYPNPAINYIDLTIDNSTLKNLNYTLFNVSGHAVATGSIQQKQTKILIPSLVSGSYVLKINQGTKQIKSFMIFKN